MGKAVHEVFNSAWHGLFIWHISQNAVKHLSSQIEQEPEDEEESSILSDFSSCMYQYEQKVDFEEAFDTMRLKVRK